MLPSSLLISQNSQGALFSWDQHSHLMLTPPGVQPRPCDLGWKYYIKFKPPHSGWKAYAPVSHHGCIQIKIFPLLQPICPPRAPINSCPLNVRVYNRVDMCMGLPYFTRQHSACLVFSFKDILPLYCLSVNIVGPIQARISAEDHIVLCPLQSYLPWLPSSFIISILRWKK